MTIEELRRYAKTFPSQGGVEIGPWLEKYAAGVPAGSAIVEVGCWLGGGTAHLALGAIQSRAVIYTHDRFMCVGQEKEKAERYRINLTAHEDTLPRVKAALDHFGVEIVYRKINLKNLTWDSGPIGLYVDDATKVEPLWLKAMEVFKPHFLAGKTHLFLQDYHFDLKGGPNYAAQKRYMKKHAKEFQLIEDKLAGTSCALFRFTG